MPGARRPSSLVSRMRMRECRGRASGRTQAIGVTGFRPKVSNDRLLAVTKPPPEDRRQCGDKSRSKHNVRLVVSVLVATPEPRPRSLIKEPAEHEFGEQADRNRQHTANRNWSKCTRPETHLHCRGAKERCRECELQKDEPIARVPRSDQDLGPDRQPPCSLMRAPRCSAEYVADRRYRHRKKQESWKEGQNIRRRPQ